LDAQRDNISINTAIMAATPHYRAINDPVPRPDELSVKRGALYRERSKHLEG